MLDFRKTIGNFEFVPFKSWYAFKRILFSVNKRMKFMRFRFKSFNIHWYDP